MANGIEELFPELTQEGQQPTTTQEPAQIAAPEPPIPAGPSPEVLALQGQVQQLTTLVGQLATQQRPATPPTGAVDLDTLFKDQTFFTPEDTRMLLHTQEPEKFFNKLGNDIKRNVAQPLMQVIGAQSQQLQAAQRAQQEFIQRQQMEQAAKSNVETFYSSYPELKKYERMVGMEAAMIEQDMARDPRLRTMAPAQAHKYLAERVHSTLRSYGLPTDGEAPAQGEPARQQLSANTRKPGFMERGTSGRTSAPTTAKDPNAKELAGMAQHLGRQRSR